MTVHNFIYCVNILRFIILRFGAIFVLLSKYNFNWNVLHDRFVISHVCMTRLGLVSILIPEKVIL